MWFFLFFFQTLFLAENVPTDYSLNQPLHDTCILFLDIVYQWYYMFFIWIKCYTHFETYGNYYVVLVVWLKTLSLTKMSVKCKCFTNGLRVGHIKNGNYSSLRHAVFSWVAHVGIRVGKYVCYIFFSGTVNHNH